jgi:hypothetical protein
LLLVLPRTASNRQYGGPTWLCFLRFDRRPLHAFFRGSTRYRNARSFAGRASAERLCGWRWRLRICAVDRSCLLPHRNPRGVRIRSTEPSARNYSRRKPSVRRH